MEKIYLIPREGLRVPDPDLNDHLPVEGREVVNSPYWRRRLKDKEVLIGQPPSAKESKAKSRKKEADPPAENPAPAAEERSPEE